MDDDIDIEEHDVMDDPRIKLIFPDITKLKKEIFELSDEGLKEQEKLKVNNEQGFKLTDNLVKSQLEKDEKRNAFKSHKHNIQNFPIINKCSNVTENINFFRNKIILGSKPCSEVNEEKINLKVKIVLKNIDDYLEKSMRYCNICLILFSEKNTLKDHMNAYHFIQNSNNKNINARTSTSLHNIVNNQQETDRPKKCFHCNTLFLTHKLLIDHLYDVLESKLKNLTKNDVADISNTKPLSVNACNNNNALENSHINSSDCTDGNYYYQCQVCSYYFNQEKFYLAHILKKHSVKTVANISKVKFNSKCKFCSYELTKIEYYNTHLIKKHRSAVFTKWENNLLEGKSGCSKKKKFSNSKLLNTEKNADMRKDSKDSNVTETMTNTSMMKSVLFKCSTCDIHFLSSAVAIDHADHSQILINWKCTICQYFFKRNDEVLHFKQHQCSSSFTVYELCETDFAKVLFKCSMCAVHFMENDILRHVSFCEEKQVRSAYCSVCDILIDYKLKISHDQCHNIKNMIPSDFVVVNSNKSISPISHNENTKHRKIKSQSNNTLFQKPNKRICMEKAISKDMNPKRSYNKLPKKRKRIEDDSSDSDNNFKSISKKDETIVCVSNSDSNKRIFVDDEDSDPDFNSAQAYTSDSDFDESSFPPSEHSDLKEFDILSLSKRLSYKSKNQLHLLNLTYCDLCECFISRIHKLDVHLQSRCTQILKRVCTHCGLIVTAKGATSHKAFHKLNPNLKLQDFTFYNIKTNKVMLPPIPILPKCDICNACFTSKVDIVSHICREDDYLQCNVCNIKLSDLAYKLHVPFHSYILKREETKESDVTQDQSNITKNSNYMESEENVSCSSDKAVCSRQFVFLCKKCNLSVNTYEDLVEHCHLHYLGVETSTDTEVCKICNVKFESLSYKYHQDLHSLSKKRETFTVISIDVFYFGSNNEEWLKHVFKSLSEEEKKYVLQKSIYNVESRVKMTIKQPGPWNLTVYLCAKCQCFLDNMSIYKHVLNCDGKSYKNPCKFCGINYVSSLARIEHEQNVHEHPAVVSKSYRIVMFNATEHKFLNDAIANTSNRYIMYKCRNCSGVVDENHQSHKCHAEDLKKCAICGLLLIKKLYDQHVCKHETFDSYIVNNMKVILFGCKNVDNSKYKRDIVCSFNGMVCDYSLYKCSRCQVCVRYVRPSSKHSCLIDAAKLQCSKCQLYFDEGKMKGHLKQHSSDPDFCRDNMLVIPFDPEECNNRIKLKGERFREDSSDREKLNVMPENPTSINKNNITILTDTIYKCACDLHHLTKSNMTEHCRKVCDSTKKTHRQTCSKCGLGFTPNVLFKHLLKHHGDDSVQYNLRVINV